MFLNLEELCMMLLRTDAKFEPGSVKRNWCKVGLNVLHDLHDNEASGYYEAETREEGERIFKNTKKSSKVDNKIDNKYSVLRGSNHEKWQNMNRDFY